MHHTVRQQANPVNTYGRDRKAFRPQGATARAAVPERDPRCAVSAPNRLYHAVTKTARREALSPARRDVLNSQWCEGGPASTLKLWFSTAQIHPTPATVRKHPVRK